MAFNVNQLVKVVHEGNALNGAVGQVEALHESSCDVKIAGVVNGEEVNGVFDIANVNLEVVA